MLSAILAAVPTNSLVGYYDPWLDYDESGDIDMKDVAASARAFGSLGDPTKNMTVTNWPVSSQEVVWHGERLTWSMWSSRYDSSGFCHMHILVVVLGLEGSESVTLRVSGQHDVMDVIAYTITLTATSNRKDATIFVPSERFRFNALNNDDATADIYLSFYLTWA